MRFSPVFSVIAAAAIVLPALGHPYPVADNSLPRRASPVTDDLSTRSMRSDILARALAEEIVARAYPMSSGLQQRGDERINEVVEQKLQKQLTGVARTNQWVEEQRKQREKGDPMESPNSRKQRHGNQPSQQPATTTKTHN